ncbi:MAG: M23 family metallopeptidase [Clostridia bacterium]|nr:M23 family metallopeptidase [Clostridia bacterium]
MEEIAKNKYTKEDIDLLFKDELKNHYIKREISIGNNIQDVRNYPTYKVEENIEEEKKNISGKFKYKLMIKVVLSLFICFCVVGYRYIENPEIKNNSVVNWIKSEYKKSYSKVEVIENIEELSKNIYAKIENVIPNEIYNKVLDNYLNKIKPEIVNFNLKNLFENASIDNTVAVFNEDNIDLDTENLAVAEEVVVTSSAVSLMGMDVEEIKSKNISIVLPVNGTITSIYGAREEIFVNVGYHTGIDIANVINTPVSSATDGTVILAQSMDKYYGNNIEIENNGVIFKYAHLNQINVKEGDIIKQGDVIGLMGSTGASTGSHLHFEIKINDRTVDPELLLKFR